MYVDLHVHRSRNYCSGDIRTCTFRNRQIVRCSRRIHRLRWRQRFIGDDLEDRRPQPFAYPPTLDGVDGVSLARVLVRLRLLLRLLLSVLLLVLLLVHRRRRRT